MMKWAYFSAALLVGTCLPAQADVISIADPKYQVPNDASGVIRPTRGMSMASVAQRFGQPTQKQAPVGEPPITRWVYPDFVVFFEYSTVIHSVVPR